MTTSELLHLSQHDELTQISNRRTFDEMLDFFYYEQYVRMKAPLSILFIDVDFFKNYNDFYGHQMGDKVISSIAAAIKNSIRHVDFVARYGGEEFVVLLPETDAQGAYAVASNIYKAIERLAIPHANVFSVSKVCHHQFRDYRLYGRAKDLSKIGGLFMRQIRLYIGQNSLGVIRFIIKPLQVEIA